MAISGTSPVDGDPVDEERDFRGSKRLTGREEWFWYIFAATTYIVAGIWYKFLLNWIIGPVWLVAVICIGPVIASRASEIFAKRS